MSNNIVHVVSSEVVRLAKYNLYRYIGCIIYQSNWSRPFSLMVMTPDFKSGNRDSRPGHVESFYLHVFISPPTTFGAWHQNDYRPIGLNTGSRFIWNTGYIGSIDTSNQTFVYQTKIKPRLWNI